MSFLFSDNILYVRLFFLVVVEIKYPWGSETKPTSMVRHMTPQIPSEKEENKKSYILIVRIRHQLLRLKCVLYLLFLKTLWHVTFYVIEFPRLASSLFLEQRRSVPCRSPGLSSLFPVVLLLFPSWFIRRIHVLLHCIYRWLINLWRENGICSTKQPSHFCATHLFFVPRFATKIWIWVPPRHQLSLFVVSQNTVPPTAVKSPVFFS